MVEGFKHTEIGLIPNDWNDKPLGSISNSVASGKSKTQSDIGGKYFIYGSTGVIGQCIKPDYSGEKILVARVGANAGTVNQVSGEYSVSDNTLMVQLKGDVDFTFIFYFLTYSNLNKLIFGSGQPLITGTQLKNLVVPLPPTKAEQTAIATALNNADTLIQKLEQLIAKKRLIKQGAMQELLKPKEGWEVKKLGEVANCFAGGTPSTFVKEYWGGNIIWLQSGRCQNDIIRKQQKEITITEKGLSNSAAKLIKPNSVLVAITGATCGNIGYLEFCAAANQSVVAIEPYNMINSKFLYYVFLTKRKEILSLQTGSAQGGTNLKSIKSIEIIFTSPEEQTRIAQILTDMDSEIEALERQLAKYKQLKQGMMQVLLTGKIRLVKPVKARHTLSHQHAEKNG